MGKRMVELRMDCDKLAELKWMLRERRYTYEQAIREALENGLAPLSSAKCRVEFRIDEELYNVLREFAIKAGHGRVADIARGLLLAWMEAARNADSGIRGLRGGEQAEEA